MKLKTLRCIILDFMLYLLYGQEKRKKNHEKRSKNTTDLKAEVFFPQLYFFTLSQKVVFFNFFSNFNSDAKLGPRLSALRTQSRFRLLFLRFYQRFSKMELHFSFFLSELYYCSSLYYILRIKLWYCFNLFVHLLISSPTFINLHTHRAQIQKGTLHINEHEKYHHHILWSRSNPDFLIFWADEWMNSSPCHV